MEHAVDIVAAIVWPLLVLALVYLLRKPLRQEVLPRLTGVSAFGISLSFAEEALAKASEHRPGVTSKSRSDVVHRLRREVPLLTGARILWVDVNPRNNFHEHKLFERAGANVDPVVSTADALKQLRLHPYDVIISNWTRPDDPDAGQKLIPRLRDAGVHSPVIFYVGRVEGRSEHGGFALTTRPDELVHYVLDALKLRRY